MPIPGIVKCYVFVLIKHLYALLKRGCWLRLAVEEEVERHLREIQFEEGDLMALTLTSWSYGLLDVVFFALYSLYSRQPRHGKRSTNT